MFSGSHVVRVAPMWLRAAFDNTNRISIQASDGMETWRVLSQWAAPVANARDPQLLFHADRWWMVFGNGGFGHTSSFGLAVSDDIINWTFVGNISCAPHVPSGGMVWQPILAHDADGKVYCVICNINQNYLFLRPTDEGDLSTLRVVATHSLLDIVCQSAFFHNGSYYIVGNHDGGASHDYYTAPSATGPYTLQGSIESIGGDSIGITYDSGTWYCFLDGPDATMEHGCIAFQTAASLDDPFGDVQIGMIDALIPRRENFSKNPSARRYHGWASQSIRAAMDRLLASPQRPPTRMQGPFYYAATGAASAAAEPRWADFRPRISSGNGVPGNTAHVVLFNSPFFSWTATGSALLSTLRSFEVVAVIESSYHATSPIRLLIGVQDGDTNLTNVGFGLEFTNSQIELLIHDGVTLLRTARAWTPNFESTIRIVRYFSFIQVMVDGVVLFTEGGLPLNGPNLNWRAISLATEFVSGGQAQAWVKDASFRFLD